jgi:hypothetical protein
VATGKNDHLITNDNFGPLWPLAPGSAWTDQDYTNQAWTGADAFVYCDELPGGNDEKNLGKDSSDGDEAKADEGTASSGSASSSSSSSAEAS